MEPDLEGDVLPLRHLAARPPTPATMLVYHASIGEPNVMGLLLERRNGSCWCSATSPRPYVATVDPHLAAGSPALGRLAALAGKSSRRCGVRPSTPQLARWATTTWRCGPAPRPGGVAGHRARRLTAERLAADADRPLFHLRRSARPAQANRPAAVGLPHAPTYLPEARLAVVGATRNVGYARALEALARELNLDVTFTGRVTDAELAAFYGAASAFATMSEHEGIGIPLLEAMAHGVPVVARSWAAIPETLAGAGLLFPAGAGPLLVAEALDCVHSDEGARKLLIDGGRERVAGLDAVGAQADFLRHLSAVL